MSFEVGAFVEEESRNYELDTRSCKRKQSDAEKLDLKSKELDVKSKECDVRLKEAETRKRIRDITYEMLDKAVDRLSTLCPDGMVDKDIEATLKTAYRQMIEDA
jgi:hypothetical protein